LQGKNATIDVKQIQSKKIQIKIQFWATALLGCICVTQTALANSVWHCSRSDVQIADASDQFTLAALPLEKEIVRITLHDLYSVYQGNSARRSGGLPLSACVLTGESSMTSTTLESIGAKPSTIKAILNKTALTKSACS